MRQTKSVTLCCVCVCDSLSFQKRLPFVRAWLVIDKEEEEEELVLGQ